MNEQKPIEGRPKPEAPSDAKPAYCRVCGAPAGLHNAGRAARRPSDSAKGEGEIHVTGDE